MRGGATLHSLPGEWIDRHGRPRPPMLVRRIVVLKLDHISDLLIASQAFGLLRHFFPEAGIDLICGTWNVGLAQRMDLFDRVYGTDVFHRISGDPQTRQEAVSALEQLSVGRYDIAIDLRYEADTRPILPAIDARIYAGFGTNREFPFLDVALPMQMAAGPPEPDRSYEAVLAGEDFSPASSDAPAPHPGGRWRSNSITAEKTALDIELTIVGAKSPAACGISSDQRLLGVALEHLTIAAETVEPDPAGARIIGPGHPDLALLAGWDKPEPFGVWSVAKRARLSLLLPDDLAGERMRLGLSFKAHVNPANPIVGCTINVLPAEAVRLLVFDRNLPDRTVTLSIDRRNRAFALQSEPLRLAAGSYVGTLRLDLPMPILDRMELELAVRGADTGGILLRRSIGSDQLLQGNCAVQFAFEIEPAGEPISFTVTVNDAALFAGARLEEMRLFCARPHDSALPVSHREHWASLLVFRVAQLFSHRELPGARHVPRALVKPVVAPDGSVLSTARGRIHDWHDAGNSVVGLALGCNSDLRKWPFNYFVALARQLLDRGDISIVLLGGPDDAEEAASACEQLDLDSAIHSLCGRVDLADLGSVLQQLDLFIGSNTGTTHYAGKVGVRTIGIHAGTNHPREWGPIGPNASWIYRGEPGTPCRFHDMRECGFAHASLLELTPDRVLAILEPELAAIRARRQEAAVPQSTAVPVMEDSRVVAEIGSPA